MRVANREEERAALSVVLAVYDVSDAADRNPERQSGGARVEIAAA